MNDLHFEDDQGLWEIVWRLNTWCPAAERDRKISLERDVVFGLLSEERIELRRIEWPSSDGPLLSDERGAPPWT